ncbi:YceI family protein [Cecembia calidifontis]|uniref:Polyisoprenoid-binding protein YceI n=1 Tax=Cecembia calidifontis TaxID=1187080 RepID=A0A4Q7PE26_9BACT|nr:YceI family protein [Cecembia calidifontis]RZS98028.1 polyisoprenoid-binding protein YceI [Cecembia calidifontis]
MKLLQKTGLFLAAVLMVVACGPGNNTVETGDAQEVAAGSGVTLTVDPSSSKINWTGYKPAGKHWGFIPVTEGEVMVEGDALTGARFVFDITGLKIEDMEESNENYPKLWGHLQSADFFDAANFPQAVFELTGVEPFSAGSIEDKDEFVTDFTPAKDSELAGNPTHWISGNLTMRGTTKNIKFPARVSVSNGTVTAKAGFNIDRTAWGLSYGDESNAVDKAKDQFIYNTVSVQFDIQAN